MKHYDDSFPVAALTMGELKEFLSEMCITLGISGNAINAKNSSGNLVYGIRGIEKLFGVSHKTAQYYKDHVIREAVMQNGRKIVVDADLALKLFNERRAK